MLTMPQSQRAEGQIVEGPAKRVQTCEMLRCKPYDWLPSLPGD